MLLLALDTSTRQSSIALCSKDELYIEYTWFSGNNHSVELLANIQRCVAASQFSLQQLDAVAVASGPGSFNGVRVALATAKALAFALKKPLIGVSTLEIIAAQQQYERMPICAVLEAGRSELYAACYRSEMLRSEHGALTYRLQRLSDYYLQTPQQLVVTLQEHAHDWFGTADKQPLSSLLFCGEISTATRQALQMQWPENSFFASALQSTRRASSLAQLALQRLQEGKEDDPLVLEPLYIRRPSITTSSRKRSLLDGTTQRPTGPHTTEREEGALRH